MNISVQITGAQMKRLRGLLSSPAVQDAAKRGLLVAAMRGRTRAVTLSARRRKVDTGRFRNSWKAERIAQGAVLLNSAPYAAVIEGGRRPGARMPPLGPIEAWARRKGIDIPAFVIARAIARRGIPGAFILRDTLPVVQKAVKREVSSAVRAALASLTGGTP